MSDKWDDEAFVMRCVGAAFRRRCQTDPAYLWHVVETAPGELLVLIPHIGRIEWAKLGFPAAWGDVPGRLTWRQWIDAARDASTITFDGTERALLEEQSAAVEYRQARATPPAPPRPAKRKDSPAELFVVS